MAMDKKFPADLLLGSGEKARRELEKSLQSLKEAGDKFSITTTLKLEEFSGKPKPKKLDLPTSFPGPSEIDVEPQPPKKEEELMAEKDEADVAARRRRSFPPKSIVGSKDTKKMHLPKRKSFRPKRAKRAAVKLKNNL